MLRVFSTSDVSNNVYYIHHLYLFFTVVYALFLYTFSLRQRHLYINIYYKGIFYFNFFYIYVYVISLNI
jgi:heme A synthase